MIEKRQRSRIGVVGYCPPTIFDGKKALKLIQEAYDHVSVDFNGFGKVVVSGLINAGIPGLAYQEAKRRKWDTTGMACELAYAFKDSWFPVDIAPVIIGGRWGDESTLLVHSIDALIRIGGGPQSLKEAKMAKDIGRKVYEYELERIK